MDERGKKTSDMEVLCEKKALIMNNTVYTQELILSITFPVLAI